MFDLCKQISKIDFLSIIAGKTPLVCGALFFLPQMFSHSAILLRCNFFGLFEKFVIYYCQRRTL